jgi:D-alanyl-D-alanine carboxypeptidase
MMPKKKPRAREAGKGTKGVQTRPGQYVRNILFMAVFGCLCLVMPIAALAAPFAAIVMDARSGEVLYETNADTRLHPASLTKMMTLYITFEAIAKGEITLDTMVRVSAHAASEPPSKLGLKAGQKIALRYLIRAAAVKSANDAATAIGEAIGGSEAQFAARMNRTAKALGMKGSTFKNANGLTTPGHMSTAHDMTILGRRLFYDFPQYYNIFSRRSTDAGMAKVNNTNRRFLDAYRGADGIKTGYTSAAGFNLTASAERGNKRIIATVFGGKSTAHRNAKMAELLDLGFGSAPNRVAVKKPAAPVYEKVATAQSLAPERVAAAQTSVSRSLRPRARPAPPAELLVAIKEDIRDVLTDVQAAQAATEAPEPDDNQSAAAPVALVDAASDLPADTAGPDDGPEIVAMAALMSNVRPVPRPSDLDVSSETAPEGAQAVAQLLPETVEADVETTPAALAIAASTEPLIDAAEPIDLTDFAMAEDPDAEPVQVTVDTHVAALLVSPTPRPRAEMITTTEATSIQRSEPLEVVTRISTSGGRNWGVNLGRYGSRNAAERILVKTALMETATLNEGLRKVVPRGGGYDANVLALTRDQADLACRRLQARAVQCFMMGP